MVSRAPLPPASAAPLDLEAWAALPDDVLGELVDGRLVEEEVPHIVHELVVGWLIGLFRAWIAARGGVVAASGGKFAVAPNVGRKPDVSVFLPDAPMPPRRGLVHEVPHVMVEVVSPTPRDGRRDRVEKLREYAAFGVKSYWLVDPELRTLEVLELGRGRRYVHAVAASSGVVKDIKSCPGLTVDLDALWAETDRLTAAPPQRRKSARKPRRAR